MAIAVRDSASKVREVRVVEIAGAQRGMGQVLGTVAEIERTDVIYAIMVCVDASASFSAVRLTAVMANALAHARGMTLSYGGRVTRVIRPRYRSAPTVTIAHGGAMLRVDNAS